MIETQRHRDTEKAQLDNSLSYKIIKCIESGSQGHFFSVSLCLCVSIKELK
jgi:hypothetical protein